MNDQIQNNNQPNIMDPNRPRLKKVKRPIRRVPPVTEGAQPATTSVPTPPRAGGLSAPVPPRASSFENELEDISLEGIEEKQLPEDIREVEDFNLDAMLDEEANLPVVQEKEDNFDPTNPRFIDESDLDDGSGRQPLIINGMFTKKAVGILAGVIFVLGFLIGKVLFSEEKVIRDGLQGVVINSEVPKGRARCGMAEKTQGCVLYIMNPQRQELNARDFYDLASQLTGRQRFLIETGNMRYSSVKIKPGSIAQLNIPPLQ